MSLLVRLLLRLLYPRRFAERFGGEIEWVTRAWCSARPFNAFAALADIAFIGTRMQCEGLRRDGGTMALLLLLGGAAAFVDLEETRFLPAFTFSLCAGALLGVLRPSVALVGAFLVGVAVPLAHAFAPVLAYSRSPEWLETAVAIVPTMFGAAIARLSPGRGLYGQPERMA